MKTYKDGFNVKDHKKTGSAAMETTDSEIRQFYSGTSILLSGCTGYLGKLILEKLLRTCNDLKKVYVLVRPKKGMSIKERLEKIYQCKAYGPLRSQQSNFDVKIYPIEGSLEAEDLGISKTDRQLLIENVDIIINCAASVRFDENLKKAVNINVRSVKCLLKIAHEVKNLKAFVQVSTAYSFCPMTEIDEVVYKTRIKAEDLIHIAESWDESVLTDITKSLLGKWPNTYTFTKAVAEKLISEETNFPTAIVRPPIVLNSVKEPVAGWVDTFQGLVGIFVAIGTGVVRTVPVHTNYVVEIMPSDYSVNLIISSAWDTFHGNEYKHTKGCIVYNNISDEGAKWKWGDLARSVPKTAVYPSIQAIWYPMLISVSNIQVFVVLHFVLHLIPAYIMDFFIMCSGNKPMFKKLYGKIRKVCDVLYFFASREWKFYYRNFKSLQNKLNATDKKLFYLVPDSNFTRDEYMDVLVRGCIKYLLHQPPDVLPKAKRRFMALKYIHYAVFSSMLILFLWFVLQYTFLL